jgi:regulator of nonsense transcripts 2
MADVLSGLAEYQEEVALQVVDALLEDIRIMMERNLARDNQRRISAIHYLGELYNYRMVESAVVFRTLYSLLAFGHNADGSPSHLDPPNSYFRVRLVCVLLDTCGHYFCRGLTKKKLDIFLIYFQCYLWGKEQPLPIDIEFLVHDTLASLRPKLTLFETDKEAYEAATQLEVDFKAKLNKIKPIVGDSSPSQEATTRGSVSGEDEDEDEEDEENEEEPVDTLQVCVIEINCILLVCTRLLRMNNLVAYQTREMKMRFIFCLAVTSMSHQLKMIHLWLLLTRC